MNSMTIPITPEIVAWIENNRKVMDKQPEEWLVYDPGFKQVIDAYDLAVTRPSNEIINGDCVILNGKTSAIINGKIGAEYTAIDFIGRSPLQGTFKIEQIKKACFNSCLDNAIFQHEAKSFIGIPIEGENG